MDEAHLTQIPLVVDNKYLALVREVDMLDWSTPESPLGLADFLTYRPAVLASGHPYDALRVAHSQNLAVVPVVDGGSQYLGSITRTDLLNYLTENTGLDNPGGILVLELEPRNYSLWEIARICESEDVIILSSQVHTNAETGKLEVTLKTNRTNLGGVVQSFDRHNYTVKEVFGDTSDESDVMGRYNNLMNYLNI
jgi:CBS domain-containing protein